MKIAYKTFLIALLASGVFLLQGALEIEAAPLSKKEIGKGKYKFKNRNEKKASLNMIKSQIQYGRGAAKQVNASGSFAGKMYVVKRAYDDKSDKFGADVITLTPKFKGGHSDVIKRFLIGYLEEMFDYERPDARLLAQFILYYNGVFQGKMEKFQSDYNAGAVAMLDPAKVGIKKKYTQWPGQTQLVVPLEASLGNDSGKGVPENELSEETKPTLEEEVAKVESDPNASEADKKKIVMYKIYLKKMDKYIAKKKEKEKKKIVQLIQKKKKKIQELNDYLVSEDISDKEKKKIKEEIKKEEKEIEQFQQTASNGKIYVLKTQEWKKGVSKNRMFIIDPYKDVTVLKSPYTFVTTKEFIEYAGGFVVAGNKSENDDKAFLVLLSKDDLETVKYSKYPVHWRTPLITDGGQAGAEGGAQATNDLYVIERGQGGHYLARYNTKLKRIAVSTVTITKNSHITVFNNKVYVTGNDKNSKMIQVFNKVDLKLLKTVTGTYNPL